MEFRKGMLWHMQDAINIVLDMYYRDEIDYSEIDKIALKLWNEMETQNTKAMAIARQEKESKRG